MSATYQTSTPQTLIGKAMAHVSGTGIHYRPDLVTAKINAGLVDGDWGTERGHRVSYRDGVVVVERNMPNGDRQQVATLDTVQALDGLLMIVALAGARQGVEMGSPKY